MKLELLHSTFEPGGTIPREYTCEGANQSPPLRWQEVPPECESLALICDDPDAPNGTWSHWVLYNLPAEVDELPADIPADSTLDNGGIHGRNDFGNLGYDGPCPPAGSDHTYYFRLYALDARLDLTPGATRAQLYDKMEDHILATTELQGQYAVRAVGP